MKKDQSQTSCRAEPTARPGYSKVAVQRRFAVQRRLNERPGHPLVDCLHTLIDALKGLHGALLEADIVWSEDMSTQVPPPGTVLLLTSCMAAPSSNPQALPSQWNVTACYLHRDDPHSGSCGIMMVCSPDASNDLQVAVFTQWRAALWRVLHGTHRSKPAEKDGIAAAFQEDAFVFTWLRLQKAVGRVMTAIAHADEQPSVATAAQRFRGVSDQV